MDGLLPAEAALGHVVMTAGLGKDQFFWCELCSAYTGEMARKLTKCCDRGIRNVPAVIELFASSRQPKYGTDLTARARLLVKLDVGASLSLLEWPPSIDTASPVGDGVHHDCHVNTAIGEAIVRPFPSFFFDDAAF